MNDQPSEPPGSRPRVLVIDDEPAIREALDTVLSFEGYDVATAATGEAAVEQVKGEPFDLVITDLRMPGMGGDETLAALKRLHPNLPVIVVTAHASDAAAARCSKEGALWIVRKPVDLDDLLRLVRAAVR
ncbi:response regulator [Sorangium sp. So ce1504]|uniref:response regulator n=1 Tax=Sorangium sp. So ce1504 TaxID=3133337 RepID=UPI003F6473CF